MCSQGVITSHLGLAPRGLMKVTIYHRCSAFGVYKVCSCIALFPDLDSLVQSDPSLLDEVLQQKSTERESPHMKHYHSYSSVVVTRRPDGVSLY